MCASNSFDKRLIIEQVFAHFLIQNLVLGIERGYRHNHNLRCLCSYEVTKITQLGTIVHESIWGKAVLVFQLDFEILKCIYGSLTNRD